MEDDDKLFSQKSFALVYVKKYKFNTYRKNGRISSIVSWMVHYPAATLVINFRDVFLVPGNKLIGCQNSSYVITNVFTIHNI